MKYHLCSVAGCGRQIKATSKTGVCRNHMHFGGACRCRQCQDPEFAERHRELMTARHQNRAAAAAAAKIRGDALLSDAIYIMLAMDARNADIDRFLDAALAYIGEHAAKKEGEE